MLYILTKDTTEEELQKIKNELFSRKLHRKKFDFDTQGKDLLPEIDPLKYQKKLRDEWDS